MARKPRAKKVLDVNQLIAEKKAQIAQIEADLATAKEELKQLQERKQQEEEEAVIKAIADSGKSIEDVLNFLKDKSKNN